TAHVVGSVSSSKSGGAYKDSGSAYRSGTVSLTGNSVADTKIGGVVTADVEGWADDSSGTITGTAGALIERPDHVVRHLLRTYGGAPDAETPAAAFDDFGADRLAARMESRRQVRELAAGLARQARGLTAYTGGRWIMRRRPDASPTPDLTLTDSDIIRQDDGASTLRISHVGLRELANRIEWRAGRKPDGAWVATGSVEDTTSQSRYGLREMTEDLDAVPEEIQATDRVNWELPRRATPTRR
ncbi:MAG: hypothetical protein GWN85_28465, partial [Gemmatimonadetes bacterium]|nr:hypothetical protein [Gemmatimonadota bacterium]